MNRIIAVLALVLANATLSFAQGGSLGSSSSPVMAPNGQLIAGASVSICQPLATTAASVTSNLAVLTMSSNPITAGFVAGMNIQVSGFSGADTYFNGGTFTDGTGITGGFTMLSVTSTTITYSLTHANGSATTNGTVIQQGNSSTSCAGLSTVYSDPAETLAITQPVASDGTGNWQAYTPNTGLYYVQFYGTAVRTQFRRMTSVSPANWNNIIYVDGVTNTTIQAAITAAGTTKTVIIPSTYAGLDTYTNPNNIPILDMRGPRGIAGEAKTSDATQYVSTNGNDSNDGLSMGTAKLTIASAFVQLASGGTLNLASGTYTLNGGSTNIPSNVKIQGAGRFATILRLANAQNNYLLSFVGASTGVTLLDLTLDGNKANQTANADLLSSANSTSISKIVVQRVRFINAWSRGIAFVFAGLGATDVLITDDEFENNGTNNGSDQTGSFGDIVLPGASRVTITDNRFNGTGGHAIQSGTRAAGLTSDWIVSGNKVNGSLGYAVAMGGGAGSGSTVAITNNDFNLPATLQNGVDLAVWSDVVVSNNVITYGGPANGIGDAPPALRVTITGNRIVCTSPTVFQGGIVLGAIDMNISGNLVSGCGNNGIALAVASTEAHHGLVVSNNITKNNSQSNSNNSGIALFISSGGTGTATGIIIKGNRAYDDQGSPTQAYGIGLAVSGQATGYSNITIEGNDVRGNKTGGINNGATSTSGLLVVNNPGDTNVGVCASNASPAVCGVASSGSVAIANPATTVVVNTTAVGSASKIIVFEDSSLGTLLGVTCNTTLGRTYAVTARTSGTSFTITTSATPAANSACLNYQIVPAN